MEGLDGDGEGGAEGLVVPDGVDEVGGDREEGEVGVL